MDCLGEGEPRRALATAAALGLMHAVVDATSVAVLYWSMYGDGASPRVPRESIWQPVLLYTVLAFGTQFSLGAIADRWRAYRATLLAGLGLVAAAVAIVSIAPGTANMLGALGNAAFHVGAGATVLRCSIRTTAATGIFVGPGAIGLATGTAWVRSLHQAPWPLLGPLAVCAAFAWAMKAQRSAGTRPATPLALPNPIWAICTGAILLVIAARSSHSNALAVIHQEANAVLWGLAIATCVGNVVGGFLADRLGWVTTCLSAILLSVPLLSIVDSRPAAVAGMFLFQMTMPVTLSALGRVFLGEAGLAFGLGALGVLLGVVPAYVLPSAWLTPPSVLFSLSLLSVVAILVGVAPIATARKVAICGHDR